jgi:hypothetical protein
MADFDNDGSYMVRHRNLQIYSGAQLNIMDIKSHNAMNDNRYRVKLS